MSVVYVDFIIAPYGEDEFISDLTWTRDMDGTYETHHYFVDYPGVKELERSLTEVVGGEPFVRYSLASVIRAFLDDVQHGDIVAFKDNSHRNIFKGVLEGLDMRCSAPTCSFEDVIAMEDEKRMVMWIIEEARTEAAQRFGNSL